MSASTSSRESGRHLPTLMPRSVKGPMRTRFSVKTLCSTRAKVRRTSRFLPSRRVTSKLEWEAVRRKTTTRAPAVRPSERCTPLRTFCTDSSLILPWTLTA